MSYQKNNDFVKTAWDGSRLGWLKLSCVEKIGPKTLEKLIKTFGEQGGEAAAKASQEDFIKAGVPGTQAHDIIKNLEGVDCDKIRATMDEQNIALLMIFDTAYPKQLKQSSTPPQALFWRGAGMDNRPWLAVVGTRKMSAYGARATKIVCDGLVARGAGIISGLALGVDGAAHTACLEAGGKTIAVLGTGVDDAGIYPAAHLNLAKKIIDTGGALISEYAPGTEGFKSHFPIRNRIIATLSQATVVVEADEQSGSMLTAIKALEENRDVFAVPGMITSSLSRGTHKLLKMGAGLCTEAADVLGEGHKQPGQELAQRDLSDDEKKVLDLCRTPTHVDDVARLLGMSAALTTATISTLELMDAVMDTGGKIYETTALGRRSL